MRGLLFLVPVILLWAATPLLVTELSMELPIWEVNWLATGFSLAALVLGNTLLKQWRTLRACGWREVGSMALLGASGIFPYTSLYYLAFSLAPEAAGDLNILNYLWPIWVLLLAVPLLEEPLHWNRLLSVLLGFAGVYLLVAGRGGPRFQGRHWPAYLSAAGGAFFWGLFSVLAKRQRREPLPAMLIYSLSAFFCFTVLALALGRLQAPSLSAWALLALLGGAVNGLGYLFWILALRQGDTARTATLVYLTPFVALLYLALFRGRPVRPLQLAALALILAGPVLERFLARSGGREGRG